MVSNCRVGALPQGETLRIPEVIGGKKVRAIAPGAFEGRGEFTDLQFPSNLIRIGENAFRRCGRLRRVIAMGGCERLKVERGVFFRL